MPTTKLSVLAVQMAPRAAEEHLELVLRRDDFQFYLGTWRGPGFGGIVQTGGFFGVGLMTPWSAIGVRGQAWAAGAYSSAAATARAARARIPANLPCLPSRCP